MLGSACLGLAILLPGCKKSEAKEGPPPAPAVEVVIEKPSVQEVEDLLAAIGTVEANERVELRPEAPGVIEAIHFTEGQRVKKGSKLFDLDAQRENALLAQSQAEEKLASANLSRAKTLAGTKAISQQDVDQLESQLAVRNATQQVERERLADRVILAPFDGVLGPRQVSVGQYVNMGAPLGVLVDDSQVKVRFRIPERHLAKVRLEQEGRLRVAAYPGEAFAGKIDLINPEVDEATRTAELRLVAPNPEGRLRPGMFARVELITGKRPNAIVVPEGALVASMDAFSVYFVETNTAYLRPVKLGVRLPGKVEIAEGLSLDQPIVVSGTQKIPVDGTKVTPAGKKEAPAPAQTAAR